jgi:hypothetical protein
MSIKKFQVALMAAAVAALSFVIGTSDAEAATPRYRIRVQQSQMVLQADCLVTECMIVQVPAESISNGSRWFIHSAFGGFERYQLADQQIRDASGQLVSGCIDLAAGGASSQANLPIVLRPCTSSNTQNWAFRHVGNEFYQIQNRFFPAQWWRIGDLSNAPFKVLVQFPDLPQNSSFRWEQV